MLRIVKTVNGIVEGIPAADPRITAFKGIPFAAPPTGKNRFRAPQPPENWSGTLKAYKFAPISVQNVPGLDEDNLYTREWNVDPEIEMDEDCLYLNVWTPAKKEDEKLPVLVWFYGGGLQVGNPAEMEFDGERLARRGIIVVTVNYRVNVFGFLATRELFEKQPEAPTNFGHLDQQAGLKWVKENIEAFGGDSGNVTIAGQSAGGGSVMSHLTSPQSEGLFHRVIVESGIIKSPYNYGMIKGAADAQSAIEAGEKFLDFIGAANLEEARAMDAMYIRDKYAQFHGFFGTVIDNKFCFGDQFTRFMNNEKANVPVMAGLTIDEFPNVFPPVKDEQEFISKTKELFGEKADEYLSLVGYGKESFENVLKNTSVRPIECSIRSLFERTCGKNDYYMYLFDTEIPGWDNPGNFHSVDLWFFFETLAKCWRPFKGRHYDEARLMCNYWANYVKTGDPNGIDSDGSDMPKWEKYTNENPYYIKFSDKGVGMEHKPTEKLERFLTEILKEKY